MRISRKSGEPRIEVAVCVILAAVCVILAALAFVDTVILIADAHDRSVYAQLGMTESHYAQMVANRAARAISEWACALGASAAFFLTAFRGKIAKMSLARKVGEEWKNTNSR